jgi:hypothetical protein
MGSPDRCAPALHSAIAGCGSASTKIKLSNGIEAEGGGAARRLTPTRSEMKGRNPDGCHMNEAGTLANAALWAAFIK